MRILLGPAGSPVASTLEGIAKIKELGLQCMEVQFSHGIKMSRELAKKIGEERKKFEVELSCHAPFFINLASEEKEKIEASKKRILGSCERMHCMGGGFVVFHPAYFGSLEKEKVFESAKQGIEEMQGEIKRKKWNCELAPETTGKHSALGSLDETIRLVKETGCKLCIDPAHLYARGNGKLDFKEMLDKVEKLRHSHYHFHFSGIEYTAKGERFHKNLNSSPAFEPFAREILKRKLNCTIISESPITWQDSLKMKRIFEKLGYKFF